MWKAAPSDRRASGQGRTNPQADVLVTVPPFIQRAAKSNYWPPLPAGVARRSPALTTDYAPLVNNYLTFIYYSGQLLKTAPASWRDLLDSRFKNKLQYSRRRVRRATQYRGDAAGVPQPRR